ncbi:amine dehydrogenase [Salinisphaera shabanensis T35B1]
MLIIRGVNVFPTQIEEVICKQKGLAPHYLIELTREGNLDHVALTVERAHDFDEHSTEDETLSNLQQHIKSYIGISTGWQLMTISPALNQLCVLVHKDHGDRNWEDPSDTIWAFDLDTHEKVGELKTENYVWSMNATSDDAPLLLGVNIDGGLDVFDLTKMEYMHTVDGISAIPALVLSSH